MPKEIQQRYYVCMCRVYIYMSVYIRAYAPSQKINYGQQMDGTV